MEWGAIPRELVTVKPFRRISQIHANALYSRLNRDAQLRASVFLWEKRAIFFVQTKFAVLYSNNGTAVGIAVAPTLFVQGD